MRRPFRHAGLGAHLADGPVEGRLGDIALGPDCRDTVLERRVVWIGDTILDGLIEVAAKPENSLVNP